jgi:NAD(P)-dependent dehydrogenase (short-subunit alcohol dehydrogenase family)
MSSDSKGVALVTGAGHPHGIGHATAIRLAADGFDVAVNDISANEKILGELVKEIQGQGRRSCQIIADVSQEDQVKAMIETVVREFGGLDVVSIGILLADRGSLALIQF